MIERLKTTMANMAQMHETKTEKMIQEADSQTKRFKDEIAQLNENLAK